MVDTLTVRTGEVRPTFEVPTDMQPVAEFGNLYRHHFQRLWVIAAGITGRSVEADDLLQEAAIIAMRQFHKFSSGTSFPAWMAAILRLTWRNVQRSESRRKVREEASAIHERTDPTSVGDLSSQVLPGGHLAPTQSMFDDRVMAALQQLSETARSCLMLHVIEDLSYGQIAEILAIPEGTAMSHVSRARQRLREILSSPTPLRQD